MFPEWLELSFRERSNLPSEKANLHLTILQLANGKNEENEHIPLPASKSRKVTIVI